MSDADFKDCDTSEPIIIEVTVSPVPNELIDDRAFGLDLRGWDPDSAEIHDEPEDGDEPALTVRLEVDSTLEPSWTVVNDRLPEGKPIRARDRERLGVVRLGERPDTHFTWGRGSGLTRLAASIQETEHLLGEVLRDARTAVAELDLSELDDTLEQTADSARSIGAGLEDDELGVRLDPRATLGRASALSLHRRDVPLSASGLGTRRLVGLAIQSLAVPEGGILLIDEIEAGLEPHRLRHLLRVLKAAVDRSDEGHMTAGQVILTTHSSVAVCELTAEAIHVTRADRDGALHVRQAHKRLQWLVRSQPEALLGRSTLMCEGKTEAGLIRGLAGPWSQRHDGTPLAQLGVVAADGGGASKAAKTARRLSQLGYRVLFFADSDTEPTPSVDQLQTAGVTVVQWEGQVCTEERLASDLPLGALVSVIDYLLDEHGDHVLDLLCRELEIGTVASADELADEVDEDALRDALASRAIQHKWLKRIDHGEALGHTIAEYWDELDGTDLKAQLSSIEAWSYA